MNVLLEGAAWDFINVRRTVKAQGLPVGGVLPLLARRAPGPRREGRGAGARADAPVGRRDRGPRAWWTAIPAGRSPSWSTSRRRRSNGSSACASRSTTIVRILRALKFECEVSGDHADPHAVIRATAPDHRLDIGTGVVGRADIVEEMARVYGYERIPETMLAEVIPPPHPNRDLELEERVRDVLVSVGLQEIVTYSLTSPEREARLRDAAADGGDESPYVRLANPIVVDRVVMRRTLLAGLIETAAANSRHTDRLACFEVGNVFLPQAGRGAAGRAAARRHAGVGRAVAAGLAAGGSRRRWTSST